jgi:hypothetical protein
MREETELVWKTTGAHEREREGTANIEERIVLPRFTAVNGDSHGQSFRHMVDNPKEPAQKLSRLTTGMRTSTPTYGQQGWRAAEYMEPELRSDSALQQSPGSSKRKRDDHEPASENRHEHQNTTGIESPKRRMTGTGVERRSPRPENDTANDVPRSATHMSIAPSSR